MAHITITLIIVLALLIAYYFAVYYSIEKTPDKNRIYTRTLKKVHGWKQANKDSFFLVMVSTNNKWWTREACRFTWVRQVPYQQLSDQKMEEIFEQMKYEIDSQIIKIGRDHYKS